VQVPFFWRLWKMYLTYKTTQQLTTLKSSSVLPYYVNSFVLEVKDNIFYKFVKTFIKKNKKKKSKHKNSKWWLNPRWRKKRDFQFKYPNDHSTTFLRRRKCFNSKFKVKKIFLNFSKIEMMECSGHFVKNFFWRQKTQRFSFFLLHKGLIKILNILRSQNSLLKN
jgi:hypothetical protein